MIVIRIVFLILFVFSTMQLFSQSFFGIVINSEDKSPIENANISVLNSNRGTSSDSDGNFELELSNKNLNLIRISCVGFATIEMEVPLSPQSDKFVIKLNPTSFQLNKSIIVTASKNEVVSFDSPDAITVLDAEELTNNSPRSMAEALIGATGVWMQKTNHGGGSPFIRGLTGNQTLLLVDGIRLNNSTFRYGPNQYFNTIDIFSVDQVETVRGKGSVLFGSDALGGVINVITRSPEFLHANPKLSGRGKVKYMNKDMEYSGAGELAFRSKNFSVLANTSYKDFGDIYAGGDLGYQRPSGYTETGVNVKGKLRLIDNIQITSAYQYLIQNEVPRYDQVAERGYKTYLFDPQIHRLFYTKLFFYGENPYFQKVTLNYSNQISDETRKKQKENSSEITTETDVVKTNGLSLETFSVFSTKWNAVTGIEFYADHVNSRKEIREEGSTEVSTERGLYPDNSTMKNLAVFTQHTLTFKILEMQLGGRYNKSFLNSDDDEFGNVELKPDALVGNIALSFLPDKKNRIILSANSAFRAPNINDISSFGSFDYGIEIPSKNLSPEKTISLELGYKRKTDQFSFSFFTFYTRLKDQIVRVPEQYNGSDYYEGEKVYTKKNVAKSNIFGIEAESGIKLSPQFSLINNITWLYGEDLENDKPMRRIPPLNGKIALRYSKSKLFGETEFLFATKQDRLSDGDIDDHRIPDGGTPGWTVLNLKAGYTLKNVSFHAAIQNIFNEAYRIHGSGVDGYGRSLWLSLLFEIG